MCLVFAASWTALLRTMLVGLMRRKADHELLADPTKYFPACGAVGFAPGGPRPCDRRIEQEASAEAACHVHLRARPETHEGEMLSRPACQGRSRAARGNMLLKR